MLLFFLKELFAIVHKILQRIFNYFRQFTHLTTKNDLRHFGAT